MSARLDFDPAGEFVDVVVPDPLGLTSGITVRLDTEQVERAYSTLRASQLGADMKGDL